MNVFVYNKNTIEFITVAKEYVSLCEQAYKMNALSEVTIILRLLPLLYLKALLLPDFENNNDEEVLEVVDECTYNSIKSNFEELLGELDVDCIIPESISQNNEQNYASLSEIIADIYQDMKNVVVNFQSGNEIIMENSLYTCKHNFETYTGQRIISAMSTIHQLIFFQKEAFENIKSKQAKNIEDIDTSQWIIRKIQENFRH